jgi:D-amino-acid dehydrogenase
MSGVEVVPGRLQRVGIVGAGMVGLATAWFLQERGVEVTVLESRQVAAGSSWGNAGWLAPALTTPLPAPAVLRYGLRAVVDPRSPVHLPPSADRQLWRFLVGFARHCTPRHRRRAMEAYLPLNEQALDAFDELAAGGVAAPVHEADPFLVCFRGPAQRRGLLRELEEMQAVGQKVDAEPLSGADARGLEPALSEQVGAAVLLRGQRFIDPGGYLQALADAVRARGGEILEGEEVIDVREIGDDAVACTENGVHRFDAVVVASGALLTRLTRRFGVRGSVQAGRGYSFSVPTRHVPAGPIYLPEQRVACTPLAGRLRIAGMMEFRRPDDRLDPRRVRAVVEAVRPFLDGVDLTDRRDEWVGSRPCTVDGLPLVGPTASNRVHVAGGHGMWGIVLGPITGRLLVEAIVSGRVPPALAALDPLR